MLGSMPELSSAAATVGAVSLDITHLFEQAHWIVKVVMILLTIMFVVGVYIIIFKTMYLRRATGE